MKCSLRFWFLSTAFLLAFVMSLLFTYSHPSMAYLDSGSPGGFHRVKLVPGYAGMQRLSQGGRLGEGCACHRCTEDAGALAWFTSHYDSNISPVWTKENMDLPLDVQRWWMMLQPQFKSHNTNEVLGKLFQIVPGENPYGSRDPRKCRRCAVVGNSGNLRGSGYGREIDRHDFVMRLANKHLHEHAATHPHGNGNVGCVVYKYHCTVHRGNHRGYGQGVLVPSSMEQRWRGDEWNQLGLTLGPSQLSPSPSKQLRNSSALSHGCPRIGAALTCRELQRASLSIHGWSRMVQS
ncbi:CMP-N-acetylneuraminate-beta-galactosamide-alpha-2,3-sialyltransferase 2 isoform X2 [Gopherus evgoodei]|uniref:CMP-N-acetylneuraminate-beta-galactosamide- alpha-2,3-sialyltransferase 2 isoform X2 n=1 Tax=Gopherus evgoodei TaxID=1825980 RepID=UPI0011CF1133|nr:CMP-N-acetylneuraminate-beta-galactosamide-alpha-2,3-sialyltransferase 2 isoform X2 [Gopherus evgoodei]